MAPAQARHIVGNTLLDLVKYLKNYEKTRGPLAMRDDARALLAGRLMLSEWYPLSTFHELLRVLDRIVVHGDELRALAIGAAGGSAMRGLHKTYVVPGDAKGGVLAMRHGWRAHYDFGVLTADPLDAGVHFALSGYPDMPMIHGLMTAGWGLAAARAAGSTSAVAEIVDRPWVGGDKLTYKILL